MSADSQSGRRRTPRKQKGQALGPRSINGKVLDVNAAAEKLGTTPKMLRTRVQRQLIPFKRWGARIVFVEAELEAYLQALPGVTVEEALANIRERGGA